jgi:DNA-binding transcriptional MerR regulator/methylmalonyl-CoA mutase cobalamin-binding subunit
MKTKNLFPIRYVVKQTDLTAHLIRVWEKRYQAVVPQRTDSNRRLYSEGDIKRLQLLKRAVDAGHSISQVANLSSDELTRLIDLGVPDVYKISSDVDRMSPSASHFYEIALTTVVKLDASGLETALDQAAVHLTRLQLINGVIVPLCIKIGELWKQGRLKIINEHLATPVIRACLWDMLHATQVYEVSPKIVITTPLGQPHELGALVIALIACESGWRSLYFGPCLPAEEIAAAVAHTKARAVALSITHHSDTHQMNLELKKLRRFLNDDIAILIGGQGASVFADPLNSVDIQVLKDIDSYRSSLDTLLETRPR